MDMKDEDILGIAKAIAIKLHRQFRPGELLRDNDVEEWQAEAALGMVNKKSLKSDASDKELVNSAARWVKNVIFNEFKKKCPTTSLDENVSEERNAPKKQILTSDREDQLFEKFLKQRKGRGGRQASAALQEVAVLHYHQRGLTDKEIAKELKISEHSVRANRKDIRMRLERIKKGK